jgi:hypothetical protein
VIDVDFDALDELLNDDPDEAARRREVEHQNNLFEAVARAMERLAGDDSIDRHEQCDWLLRQFSDEKNNKFLRERLATSHGIISLVHILQSKKNDLLACSFPFILEAGQDHHKLHKVLCILGILPYLFEYTTDANYGEAVREQALRMLHLMCTTRPGKKDVRKALQMFIAAGGLPKLAEIFRLFSHSRYSALTPLVLGIVYAALLSKSKHGAAKQLSLTHIQSGYASILAHNDFIERLAGRLVQLAPNDPSANLICEFVEQFSIADFPVRMRLANAQFVRKIFRRAKLGARSPLSTTNVLHIVTCYRNLATDTKFVAKLWEGSLERYLAEYLDVDRDGFEMNEVLEKCFETLCYMARLLTWETRPKLAKFIPIVVLLAGTESSVKTYAVTLFLECITNHANDLQIRTRLTRRRAFDVLFRLLTTHARKEQVMTALEQWCWQEPQVIQWELRQRTAEFVEVLAGFFQNEALENQPPLAKSLLLLCDKCPELTAELSQSRVIRVLITSLLNKDLTQLPQLRVIFLNLIVAMYEMTGSPKQLIAKFNVLRVAQKMSEDGSSAVKTVALQLRQAVASNYIF